MAKNGSQRSQFQEFEASEKLQQRHGFPEMATRAEGVPAPVAALQAVGVCFPSLGASLGAPLLGALEGQGGSVLPCGGRVALVSGCHHCCAVLLWGPGWPRSDVSDSEARVGCVCGGARCGTQ